MTHRLIVLARSACAAALVALLAACGSLPQPRERPPSNAAAVDPNAALAKIAAASTPPGERSGFRLMPLGVYSLDARIQLAQRAQRSLVVQYYQPRNDATGRLLLRTLREAALRGVKVRLLVDDLDTVAQPATAAGDRRTRPMSRCGCSTPSAAGAAAHLRALRPRRTIVRLNHRMHNKLFIADGVMAVGGRNIADEYFVLARRENFIDMDALVIGKVLQAARMDLRRVLELRAGLAGAGHRDGRGRPQAHRRRFRRLGRHGRAAADDRAAPANILGYGPISEELDAGRMGLLWGEAQAIADPPTKPTTMTAEEALATERHDEGLGPAARCADRRRHHLALPGARREGHGGL